MLHKVNRPDCDAQMRAILRLQYKVLAFACSSKTRLSSLEDKALFIRKLGRAGNWLFERVQGKADFRQALIDLIKHVSGDGKRRQHILRAFLNDTRFHQRWTENSFSFEFRRLEPETRLRVGALMELFYDYLLDLGFPAEMFKNGAKFNRNNFSSAFWAANEKMRVCPACDGPRPPVMRGRVSSENDHFFPNSRYPFLAVHRSNLLPVCTYCNFLKQAQDPIDYDANESLSSSFLPYELPAQEHLNVVVNRPFAGERQVQLLATEPVHQSRLKNLQRLLRLDERWADEVKATIDRLLDDLRYGPRQEGRIGELVEEPFEDWLTRELNKRQAQMGRRDGSLAAVAYLRFAISDPTEINLLRGELENSK